MTLATETDLGPLTWVKGEIDAALQRTADALDQARSAEDAAGQVQFAQTHLHQVRGALSIIGLDGLTQFADATELLLGLMARGEMPVDETTLSLSTRAVHSLGNYLEELAHGAPDQPMRLAPLYEEIAAARGLPLPCAADLFYPDLSRRPPRRSAVARDPATSQAILRQARARFERGLLEWLRGRSAGAAAMREAIADVESVQASAANRSLWWAALAFYDALLNDSLVGDIGVKRLCTQIDAQFRRLLKGAPSAPDRLLRDILYRVAGSPARTAHQHEVRACWQLDELMPLAGARVSDIPLGPLLQNLQQILAPAREQWDSFCEGTAVALGRFDDHLKALVQASAALARPATLQLIAGLSDLAQWLRRDPLKHSDAIAIEVASALLLLESDFGQRFTDVALAEQMNLRLARLEALQRGELPPAETAGHGLLHARESQEKDAITQLCREMRSSLAQVEQTLDDYFRNQNKHESLAQLHQPLQQVVGALSMLGETEALSLVRDAATRIASLASAPTEADPAEFETLAHQLSALGFYLDALPLGAARLEDFLHPERRRTEAEAAEPEPEFAPALEPQTEVGAVQVPIEPAQPLEVAAGTPEIAAEPTTEPAEAIESLFVEELEELEDLAVETAPAPQPIAPAPAAAAVLPESDAEIDAELLEIFIEEATEVLATIREHLELARSAPQDSEHLTTIRRGFHTLKGSGRMVGLSALGEAAWGLEQTMNRWLQLEWPVTPALLHLVDAAHQVFSAWVEHLQTGCGQPDASTVLSEAERLRSSDAATLEPGEVFAAPAAQPEMAAAASVTDEAWPQFPNLDLSETGEILPLHDETLLELDASFLDEQEAQPEPESAGVAEIDFGAVPEPAVAGVASTTAEPEAPTIESIELEAPEIAAVDVALPPDEVIEAELPAAEELEPAEEVLEPFEALEVEAQQPETAQEETIPPIAVEGEVGLEAEAAIEPEAWAEAETVVEFEAIPEPAEAPTPSVEVETESAAATPAAETLRIGDIEISPALYELYQSEARQHLATLAQDFERLSQHTDAQPTESAMRAAHTLAGISGTAGFNAPHELGRALEHAIERLREQGRAPQRDELAVLRRAQTALQGMLAEVALRAVPEASGTLVAELNASCHVPAPSPMPVMAEEPLAEEPLAEAQAVAATAEQGELAPATSAAAPSAPPADLLPVPQDEIDTQLLPIFLEEAAELMGQLHAAVRAWHAAPDATQYPTTIARQLHSLKGSARMAGAMALGSHLHQLESRLEDGLADKAGPGTLFEDLAFGLDLCEQMIDGLAGLPAPGAEQAAAGESATTPAAAAAAAVATVTGEVAAEGEAIASATLRVRAEQVDRFVNEAGEIGIARTRIEGELRTLRRSLLDLTENVIRLRNQLREVEIQAEVQMQSRIAQAESHHAEFDPLEMDRYTRLQELTRMMAESVNDVTTVQQTLLHNLDGADLALNGQGRTTRELQQGLMRVRMLPFDSLADRLYRVVRQSAKELGKRASLDLRGGRIEIDRSVLEQMAAPLEHLLRNAVAHGIESPADRAAAGKPETGQIVLTVTQEGNEIAIDLQDDGSGLNFERIAERARKNGLIGPDEHPDTKRLTNLIFLSGFSTAGQLSAVSGRGVGMDVVKAQTASLGGRIDVASTAGQGTNFRIYLPLTLAVTQALLVKASGRTWAIPSNMVAQAMELKPDALKRVQDERGIEWQGQHYAYRYLPRLLGDRASLPEEQRYNWLLLLRAGAQTLALHVDSMRGNQEIVVKNAGPQLTRIVGMTGATVLADGEIALILNPVALASRSLDSGTETDEARIVAEAPPVAVHQPTVMVVDDSLTVRRITGRLLEREGYRVITAKDGVDALEQLVDMVPDVVLSDIEMPRMDGFDLVRNIRADARTRQVPVIMITSRLADKHRRYAEEVGANHYLGKPYQEEELLALLAGYTRPETAAA